MRIPIQPIVAALSLWQLAVAAPSLGQSLRTGNQVPPDVERISSLAIEWLAANQTDQGDWEGGRDRHNSGQGNCTVTGLGAMAFLSTGVDPNRGQYGKHIRAALRRIIAQQDPQTGYLPNSMYNHGFGMLALAEAYGAVDDKLLWSEAGDDFPAGKRRSLAEALHLAVRCAVTSQENNEWKAWRYGPESKDADTSVTGAVVMGLLAARNAGIKVPDQSIESALQYVRQVTSKKGGAAYTPGLSGFSGSANMSAISSLTMSVSKKDNWPEYAATLRYLSANSTGHNPSYPYYNMYYMSQALFQGDYEAWSRWNQITTRRLRRLQNSDGSFDSSHGKGYATSMAVLALALNYRFLPIYER